MGLPWWLSAKESACNAGDASSIPGRSSGRGKGNPLLYSCLGNSTDRGDWQATVHRITKSLTQLKRLNTHPCTIEYADNFPYEKFKEKKRKKKPTFSSVQFSRSVVSNSLQPHESQHARPPCPLPITGVHSNSCPSSW